MFFTFADLYWAEMPMNQQIDKHGMAQMEATNLNPVIKTTSKAGEESTKHAEHRPGKFRTFMHKRWLWLVGILIVAGALVAGGFLVFGKAKVVYTTAAVERGDVENTVLAAGIVQPFKLFECEI